jgi:hypothetical protein
VQFATFPETVVPYYPYFSFVQTPWQQVYGSEYLKLFDQAERDWRGKAGIVVSIGSEEGYHRRPRLHADRQAQTADGLARPLQSSRIA